MEALKAIALPPGFGFHPTDVELVSHYLRRKNLGLEVDFEVIPELDIYKREPWDLPACCRIPTKDSKWHFFTSRDRKYPNGSRSNRATEAGYWKSTGKDRKIRFQNRVIGTKKTLVFHEGRPPCGKRTDWIMHEYYMDEKESKVTPRMKDTYVLCRITKRNGLEMEGEDVVTLTDGVEDLHKEVKNLDTKVQEVMLQEESSPSESTEDLDAWLNELFDPNFNGPVDFTFTGLPSFAEPKSEILASQAVLTTPKVEPLDYGFLLDENIGILHDDFKDMPDIAELLAVDPQSSIGTERSLPENEKLTGIMIREHIGRPTSETFNHRIELQLQTSKMESRNSTSVSHTVNFAHANQRISSSRRFQHPRKVDAGKKLEYRETGQNCIYSFMGELWNFISWCSTAGMDSCFLCVCIIGTAALFLFFLFHDCRSFLESFLESFLALGL